MLHHPKPLSSLPLPSMYHWFAKLGVHFLSGDWRQQTSGPGIAEAPRTPRNFWFKSWNLNPNIKGWCQFWWQMPNPSQLSYEKNTQKPAVKKCYLLECRIPCLKLKACSCKSTTLTAFSSACLCLKFSRTVAEFSKQHHWVLCVSTNTWVGIRNW